MNLPAGLPILALCSAFGIVAQQPAPAVYSAAQAAAGRTAYLSSCGKCHTESLLGRTGKPDELPPVDSLPKVMREVVENNGGQVPPLVGPEFLARWGSRGTDELSRRVREAVGGFPPENRSEETYLQLTAYFLQANGASRRHKRTHCKHHGSGQFSNCEH